MRERLRQRAIVSLLQTHDGPPSILAAQIFFLFDEEPFLSTISDTMTIEQVVVEVGKILHSKLRFREDVDVWARNLFEQAGLPFNISTIQTSSTSDDMDTEDNPAPLPNLCVVSSQPAAPKTVAPQKRKTRRVYLELAVRLLEKGACTYRELVEAIMEQFPNLNRETISTFASDIQNPKYSPIKDRKVVTHEGKLIFEDKIRPALTVIENPNFIENEKTDDECSIDGTVLSRGDV